MIQKGHTNGATKLSGIRDEIKAKLNISEVIGGYVQLRKAGKGFVGLCPFHQEKTASFHVDPQKGLYHCFGCHEGGDLFDFVMKVEGLSFSAALALLAEKAGVSLPDTEESEAAKQRKQQMAVLAQANALAQAFYARALQGPIGRQARAYLAQRGVQPATISRFGLGFAPDSWDALTRHLTDAGQMQAGVSAGLLVAKGTDNAYDRFRGRVMFPLQDPAGKIVAFGGRALGNAEPKYLNTSETLLYTKRRQLYGLYQAKEAIRRQKRAVVVEGYFDCIALHQAGISYAVASCGTALTVEHLQLLHRVAHELYLCFDGDKAGRSAVTRGLDALQGAELSVRVVLLPEGHDPDTFVQQEGPDAFLGLLEKALPLTDYLLETAVEQADIRTVDGQMRGVRAALPILRRVESPVERDAYIQRVAVRLGISAQSLAAEVNGENRVRSQIASERHTNQGNRNTSRDSASHGVSLPAVSPRELIERELLRSILADPSGAPSVVATLGEAPFQNDAYNKCLQFLGEEPATLAARITELLGAEAASLLSANDAHVVGWQECVTRLRLLLMREELEAMEEGLATLADRNPTQYIMHISDSLMAFRRWRRALQEQSSQHPQAS